MMLNNYLELPYNKFPLEGAVPIISKSIVKSKLSNKFHEIASNQEFKSGVENVNNKKNGQNNSVNANLKSKEEVKNYQYDMDELSNVVTKLKNEIKMKDDVIKRQNDDKTKMESRIKELEKILGNLVKMDNK